ncbi:HAD family hydrolase [soil metagenome]
MAPTFELVIFDNDGVLVDSEPLANAVLADLLAGAGHPIGVTACIERFMGGTLARVRTEVEAELGRPLPADLEDCYHADLLARFATELRPVAGVHELLDALTTPACVASSGTHDRISASLAVTGLLERFEGRIFSADDVAHGKPAPDLFLHAARSLEVDPARCVVVEDSALGVTAARAAAMTVVGYAALTPPERLAAADHIVTTMVELLPLLSA